MCLPAATCVWVAAPVYVLATLYRGAVWQVRVLVHASRLGKLLGLVVLLSFLHLRANCKRNAARPGIVSRWPFRRMRNSTRRVWAFVLHMCRPVGGHYESSVYTAESGQGDNRFASTWSVCKVSGGQVWHARAVMWSCLGCAVIDVRSL